MRMEVLNLTVPAVPVEKTKVDYSNVKYQPFGSDNLFINQVAAINRQAPAHAGILFRKLVYTMGKGLLYDDRFKEINNNGDSFEDVFENICNDDYGLGNAYAEIVTDSRTSFIHVYHKDATKARVSKDGKAIIFHPKWSAFASSKKEAVIIPKFPEFGESRNMQGEIIDDYLRSVFHLKSYQPEFDYYGLPSWLSAMDAAGICYKTNKWNISRLDNNFAGSGTLLISGDFSKEEADDLIKEFKDKLTGEGNTGKILMVVKQLGAEAGSHFTPINVNNEGDWIQLHRQSESDLVVAHNWFRSLSGLTDNTGFDTKRILNEYEMALNTVILRQQSKLLNMFTKIFDLFNIDMSSVEFQNSPPVSILTLLNANNFTKIWEARKMANLEYDENDEKQQEYVKDGKQFNDTGGGS